MDQLRHLRYGDESTPSRKPKKRKVEVVPGRSVGDPSASSQECPAGLSHEDSGKATADNSNNDMVDDTDSSDSDIEESQQERIERNFFET